MPSELGHLHHRRIALEVAVNGHSVSLQGVGAYESDPGLGKILRIHVDDPAGVEFVLAEDSWTGEIKPGAAFGCDFFISLVALSKQDSA